MTTKRLAPKLDVLREIYLKSGNQCAFAGCKESLLTQMAPLLENSVISKPPCHEVNASMTFYSD